MKQDSSAPDRVGLREAHGLPDRTQIAELLSGVPRPFVIASDRELSVLRRGLTKEGWKRSLFLQDAPADVTTLLGAGLLARANQWLTTKISIPAQGGSCEHFFCEDGAPLEVPEDILAEAGEYRCSSCGRSVSGANYDASFRRLQHMALANGCLALALVYQIDRDDEYAEKAAEILRNYAKAYRKGDAVMEEPADEARWVVPLAQAYDLIYHAKAMANGDKHLLEGNIFLPLAARLADLKACGSRGAWHTAAIGAIGSALKEADLVNTAVERLVEQVEDEVGQDGMLSGSVYNHLDALTALVQFAEACSRTGLDLYTTNQSLGRILKQMFIAPLNCVYPSFELPAINDRHFGAILPLSLYEAAYRRWNEPMFAWVLKTGYSFAKRAPSQGKDRLSITRSSLYGFLFGRDLPGRVLGPKEESSIFPSCGFCTLRSNNGTMITLDHGPFFEGGETGKMGITLFANDRVMVPDYGVPGKGAEISAYYRSALAHNTVIVDGASQARTSDSGMGLFLTGAYLQVAEATTNEAYPGVLHTRRIVLAGDVVLLLDSLESQDLHAYDWLLRAEGEIGFGEGVPRNNTSQVEGVSSRFSSPKDLGTAREFLFKWQKDGFGIAACVVSDEAGALISASCPAETAARTATAIDLRRNAFSARFAALLAPYQGDAPAIERDGNMIRISSAEATDWIYCADISQGQFGNTDFETDAEIAVAREEGGVLVACGLYKGSYIKLNGEMILLGARRFGRIEARFDCRSPIVNFEHASGDYLRVKCSARAMRVNGHRISASNFDGMASIRLVGVLAKKVE